MKKVLRSHRNRKRNKLRKNILKRRLLQKNIIAVINTAMSITVMLNRSTTMTTIKKLIVVTRKCTMLIKSIPRMVRKHITRTIKRKLRITLDFMVTKVDIPKTNSTQIINRPNKMMILIQDLKTPFQKLINQNVGPSNSQDN